MEFIDTKIWISKNASLCQVFANQVTYNPMASGNLTDENIKSLCYLLWIFETRIAITIMTNKYQQ